FPLELLQLPLELRRSHAWGGMLRGREGTDITNKFLGLRLAEPAAKGRHAGPSAIEDTHNQLRVISLLVPGAAGEVGHALRIVIALSVDGVASLAELLIQGLGLVGRWGGFL